MKHALPIAGVPLVDAEDAHRLLPVADCIGLMDAALRATQVEGAVIQPVRQVLRGASSMFGMMPVFEAGEDAVYAVKVVVVAPGNPSRGLDSHQGFVAVQDAADGSLRGLVNAAALTSIRTAAVTAVATRALAREDARVLAVIGTGGQALPHVQGQLAVRPFEEVRLASLSGTSAKALADQLGEHGVAGVTVAPDNRTAIEGADVVVTLTDAKAPIVERPWFAQGTHVNAIGASIRPYRELDDATVLDGAVYVDSLESALAQWEALASLIEAGRTTADHVRGEIGGVLTGAVPGRQPGDDLTVFKSLGLAVEDLYAAREILRRAAA